MTFNSKGPPAIYNLDIICEVRVDVLSSRLIMILSHTSTLFVVLNSSDSGLNHLPKRNLLDIICEVRVDVLSSRLIMILSHTSTLFVVLNSSDSGLNHLPKRNLFTNRHKSTHRIQVPVSELYQWIIVFLV